MAKLKNKRFRRKVLFNSSNEDRFTWIYINKLWGGKAIPAYLLTTTHKNIGGTFVNEDISTVDFRCVDLI